MTTKPTERNPETGLTKNQTAVMLEIARVGLCSAGRANDRRTPYGVFKSLVLKGLIRQTSLGSYILTAEGKELCASWCP